MKKYSVHTDLACEIEVCHDAEKSGTEYTTQTINGFESARLVVKNEIGEKLTKKKRGNYITVFTEMIHKISGEKFEALASSEEISTEEALYYAEVANRISLKLLEIEY